MNSVSQQDQESSQSLTRREREKLAHRQEIIEAATRVFARKGFFNSTIDEIAQEAEFSKGALYLYFSNKEDLLFNIIKEKFAPISDVLHTLINGKSSFRDEVHAMFSYIAEMSFKEQEFFSLILSQQIACFKALSEERAEECLDMHSEFDSLVIGRIDQAIHNGELRKIDTMAVYGLIHGATEQMMLNQWNSSSLEELLEKVNVFIDILYNGIAQEKEA